MLLVREHGDQFLEYTRFQTSDMAKWGFKRSWKLRKLFRT
jgi:hypothetical protein